MRQMLDPAAFGWPPDRGALLTNDEPEDYATAARASSRAITRTPASSGGWRVDTGTVVSTRHSSLFTTPVSPPLLNICTGRRGGTAEFLGRGEEPTTTT